MKAKVTQKTKGGKIVSGIYTTSCVPNHKPKRVRKPPVEENTDQTFNLSFNGMGILSSAIVWLTVPLPILWRLGIIAMILLSSCHVEVE